MLQPLLRVLGSTLQFIVPAECQKEEPEFGIDTRGIPSHECLNCGCNVLLIRAGFEDYDISFWFTDAECANCGSPMTAPTPCDAPDWKDD